MEIKNQNNQTLHTCVYCGQSAFYQFKNGKWCCHQKSNQCPANIQLRRQKTKQKWKHIREQGLQSFSQIPLEQRSCYKIKDFGQQGICYYCGQPASYQLKNGRWCCHQKSNQCPAIKQKNSNGLRKAYQKGTRNAKLIYQNKSQQSKKRMAWAKGKNKFNNQIIRERAQKLHERYQKGQLIGSFTGRTHTNEQIDKIIHGMTNSTRKFKQSSTSGYKRGWYKGFWCDSSWQLAFVIYNLDHNILFQRNTEGFEYFFNNKKYRFYPDFKLADGTIIEIKGWIGQKNLIKIKTLQSLLGNKFKIIYKQQMQQKYLSYVKNKYGNDFIKLYEQKPNQ